MSSSDQRVPDQANLSQKKWVESEDWEPYRQIITNLYITEKKTVTEVTQYMQQNYGFNAT